MRVQTPAPMNQRGWGVGGRERLLGVSTPSPHLETRRPMPGERVASSDYTF